MLNRRFLRIKVFQALYGMSREATPNATAFRERVLQGLDKTYELYLFLLWLPVEFRHFLEQELDMEQSKFLPLEHQLNLYHKVISNKVPALLEENVVYANARKKYKVNWSGQQDLFRKIWLVLKTHPLVEQYTASESPSFQDDKNFFLSLTEWLVGESELFEAFMEEQFVNWEDDQELVVTTLQRTYQMLKPTSSKIIADKHMDEEEDLRFVKQLFQYCTEHEEEFTGLIAERTRNWDQDRIALVDMILMKMALCEVLYFPSIPVKVSINEYLELAKLYSTPNSHGFINGVLDKVQLDLKGNNRIRKTGRGLVE